MQVFALFPTSILLETAVTCIKEVGIQTNDIFVVPVKRLNEHHTTNHRGMKLKKNRDAVDKGFAFATGISVISAGIGFRLDWGPIIWGILGAVGGFIIGYCFELILNKRKGIPLKERELPIILIVNCDDNKIAEIETMLYEQGALGVNTPLKKGSGLE